MTTKEEIKKFEDELDVLDEYFTQMRKISEEILALVQEVCKLRYKEKEDMLHDLSKCV